MISVADAMSVTGESVQELEPETLAVGDAFGRVAAEPVSAPIDLPSFAQSAMDGYAVRASDLDGADRGPIRLDLVGEVAAGEDARDLELGQGAAIQVFTGAPIPEGADAVVRRERVERDGGTIVVDEQVEVGRDVRPVGEELEAGKGLVEEGERLDEGHLAMLSMCGIDRVSVHPAPQVALLVSGDEVVPPGESRGPGEVWDANKPLVVNWLRRRAGVEPEVTVLPDDYETTRRELDAAADAADLVVSTGGVSVGDYDFLGDAAESIGGETVFWKVAQKPAKPLYLAMLGVSGGSGERGETPFLGIPGNPGAAFVSVHVYLRRLIDGLEGVAEPGPRLDRARLNARVSTSSSRHRWVGCRVERDGATTRLSPVDGHRLGALYDVDGLIAVPPDDGELEVGKTVRWIDRRGSTTGGEGL